MAGTGDAGERGALLAVARALLARRRLRLDYRDAAGAGSARVVTPLGLAFREGHWLLAAHCHLRGALRHFRVDRVASARLARGHADARLAPPGFDPRFFSAEGYLSAGRPLAGLATVALLPPLAALARALLPAALRERRGRAVLCHLRYSDPEALAALASSLGRAAALGYTGSRPCPRAAPPSPASSGSPPGSPTRDGR